MSANQPLLTEEFVPTYQYACTACGHQFDKAQAFTDAALTECPKCSGRLRKLFGSVGVVFKGDGFYRTDSRASSKQDSTKKDNAPATQSSSNEQGSVSSTATSTSAAKSSENTASSGSSAKTTTSSSAAAS